MSKTSFAALKQELREVQAERDYYMSLVGAFMEGQAPVEGNSIQHMIMAQWGRRRLVESARTASLLRVAL